MARASRTFHLASCALLVAGCSAGFGGARSTLPSDTTSSESSASVAPLGLPPDAIVRWKEKGKSKKQMGILEGSTGTSLVVLLESGALDTLAVSNLVLMERPLGQQVNVGKAGFLTAMGALLGMGIAIAMDDTPPGTWNLAGLGGLMIGGGIGLLVGVLPEQQWVPVDLSPVAGTTSTTSPP